MIPCKQITEHPQEDSSRQKTNTNGKAPTRDIVTALHQIQTYITPDPSTQSLLEQTTKLFPLRIPQTLLNRGCDSDEKSREQMLRQFLPDTRELENHKGYTEDPVGDLQAETVPGLIHKYHGRVLLITTGSCPVHCRYCFRRSFPYSDHHAKTENFSAALDYIENDTSISEVILSGGDPLSLSDEILARLTRSIAQIEHVDTLRIHTRYPIAIPQRVNQEMLDWLNTCSLHKVMVLHANHPGEIDQTVIEACARMRDVGVELLNQSVLLHGVNDDAETLIALSKKLQKAKILPYYIHLLDRVRGAHHFYVDSQTALNILQQVAARLPGYLVPRLCREVAGAASKTVISGQNR